MAEARSFCAASVHFKSRILSHLEQPAAFRNSPKFGSLFWGQRLPTEWSKTRLPRGKGSCKVLMQGEDSSSSVLTRSQELSDDGFRNLVKKLSEPATKRPSIDKEGEETTSQTFTRKNRGVERKKSSVDEESNGADEISDGANEARRQSSLEASSSASSEMKSVVDRWVSDSDDEEDYLSRRPSYYGKRDRRLETEYSEDLDSVRKARRGRKTAKRKRTVQKYVPLELLAELRRKRALEREQEKVEEKGETLAKDEQGIEEGILQETLAEDEQDASVESLDENLAEEIGDELETAFAADENAGADVSVEEEVVGLSEKLSEWEKRTQHLKGWQKARLLRRRQKRKARQPLRDLTMRVMELGRRKQLDKVFESVDRARQQGIQLDLRCFNAVISACAINGEVEKAKDVFTQMVGKGGPGVNEVTYGALLKAMGKAGRVEEALRLLELMDTPTAPGSPQVTEVHVYIVLNACAEAGDSLRARQLLEAKLARSTLAYNMLIKAHAKSATPLGALLVVDEMRAHGLALDRTTYSSLILACVNGDNMARAWELLNEMKSRSKFLEGLQLAPDVITYTTLMKGVARPGALASILKLAEEMHTCPSVSFDRTAYSALIDACISCNSVDTAESVLAEMEERGREDSKLRPGPHAFLALMRAFASEGELERCEEMRDGMFSSRCSGWASIKDRQEADELCLEAAIASGFTGPAKRYLRTMKAIKEGRSLSQRATAALVHLYASDEAFQSRDSLRLQPLRFRKDCPPAARVITRSLPLIPELMFVPEEKNADEVRALLKETPVVLVVRAQDSGGEMEFLGYLTKADLKGGDAPVVELMHPLPPPVLFDDPISHAASLLLQHSSEVLLVVETDADQPPGERALATVVGILTRGQLFEGAPSDRASVSGYETDDESGLEMIKQDLSKRGAALVEKGALTEKRESVPLFPWKTRLAQLLDIGKEKETPLVAEGLSVEDDLGLEMIRQDMLKLDGTPSAKKSAKAKEQKISREALARLAYLERLGLDSLDDEG